MNETKDLYKALDLLRQIVELNISVMPLESTNIQRLAGFLLFHVWLKEMKNDG